MAGINKVILVGRLGQDPEIRYTQGGAAVANFSVATSQEWKDKNTGEKMENTEWSRVVVWNKLAEICGEYLEKGRQVYIEGRMQTRSWEDKDGATRYTTEVIANHVMFLGSKADDNGSGKRDRYHKEGDYPEAVAAGRTSRDAEDDIPF